jgi:hypothetical protein
MKGNKPKNGFDKNPQNIAPGGYWRYKEHGKSAIIDIFKMSITDFNGLKSIGDDDKTVLDEVLYMKFKSAINGNSRDADFLFNQAFGEAPKYKEAQDLHYRTFKRQQNAIFDGFSKEEIQFFLNYLSKSSSRK